MSIQICELSPRGLGEYAAIPSQVHVKSIFQPALVEGGLGGIHLHEIPSEEPYTKDYDSCGELPTDWPEKYDVTHWGFFLALADGYPVGAAAVAFDSPGVFMLDGRHDLSVLWDIRVRPECRGVGIPLFRHAAGWSRERGCHQMKIETQNINVPACRFYQRMGAHLGEIRRFGYAAFPQLAHEVMLCWFLELYPSEKTS